MKKLKLTLTALIAMLTLATSVFAYGGMNVDTNREITMPSTLSNGKGTVSTALTGSFKYQFVEIDSTTYLIDLQLTLSI